MTNNIGWPGPEFPEYHPEPPTTEAAFTRHVNSKLPDEWFDLIENSGEPTSQWMREAARQRLVSEGLIDE